MGRRGSSPYRQLVPRRPSSKTLGKFFLVTRLIKTTKDREKELFSKEESSGSIAPENIRETF
jgi:hypothetical protein